jgi:hypothetical protein
MLYAVMPKDDYQRACNAFREYTGERETIESGELVDNINKVYDIGKTDGEESGYEKGYSAGLSQGIEVTNDATLTPDKAPEGETFYAKGKKQVGTVKVAVGGVSQVVTPAVGYENGEECVLLSFTPLEKIFLDPAVGGINMKAKYSSFGNAIKNDVKKGKTFTSSEGFLEEGTGSSYREVPNGGGIKIIIE